MGAPHLFSLPTRAWFDSSFSDPTPAQAEAWESIAAGEHTLVVAPTGSGKTLAAFLWAIDRMATEAAPTTDRRLRVLYVSPLKALAVDVERNLRSPLAGVRAAARRLELPVPEIETQIRTGDTPPEDRRRFAGRPPDILITTPESLFLLLTSRAREALASVESVIVDEVHAVAGTKRGTHLALSLERLDELLERPAQRIGLSATVRPVDEVARFLGGIQPVRVVNPPFHKELDISITVPVPDMAALGQPTGEIRSGPAHGPEERTSIWPAVEERLVELIRAHRTTIVFANSRRLAERLCARINDLAAEAAEEETEGSSTGSADPPGDIARTHHGSVSREQRRLIEEDLKAGRLPAVVATSSLELGIDIGAADLVVQVEAPPSVANGLQRIGRAGHQVGAVSRGVIFPKYRGDLVECAVVVERMRRGEIEAIAYPRNPLDVLAQQIVAMCAMDDWTVERLGAVVRRAAPFAALPERALEEVLDMLSGRYPSDEFAELRPRLVWDRVEGTLRSRGGAQRLAVTNAGTIPDRGLYGVFLATEGAARVGELDEEMVYESRPGDVFILGASSWRIEQITHDRVLVSPAPGEPGKMPFWHGDAPGRPAELGRAVGAFMSEVGGAPKAKARRRLLAAGLDDWAAGNLVAYLEEQREATGVLPDDRTIVVERFRDELGDWRLCIHSPFGAPIHAPWAIAIEAAVGDRLGIEVQTMHTDDGIVIRLPEADEAPSASSIVFEPEEIGDVVSASLGGSALFASRFRECAARALLLPKRRPGRRTPLWQQRQRSHNLLQVASSYGSFPIVLEAVRECLQDVFDLPGLERLMADLRAGAVRLVEVETVRPSPFAASLLFGYIGAFMYEGDAPLAERRAQALSLDTSLLAELLGRAEVRELVDADALAEVELEVQRLAEGRRIRDLDDLHDALRSLGDLTGDEASSRGAAPGWPEQLEAERRALWVRIAGERRWVAAEDAARFRDALGTALPMGVPEAFLEPVRDPIGDLVRRFARTHGPFVPAEVAARLGLGVAVVEETLRRLEATGRVLRGEFRPGGSGIEWCDADVLRLVRRRSLAKIRKEVEPAPRAALARFLPAWHGIGPSGTPVRGREGLIRVIEQLQGAAIPASALETLVLPSRIEGYLPSMLDEVCAAGEVSWAGAGPIGSDDGWVMLCLADAAPLLLPAPREEGLSDDAVKVRDLLDAGGAMFFRAIAERAGSVDDAALLAALWELVWAGWATNDTLAPLRALASPRRRSASRLRPAASEQPLTRPSLHMGHLGRRRVTLPRAAGPPSAAGRWSLLPPRSENATLRQHALAEQLLVRHGVLTRPAVMAERVAGGFAGVYPVLKAMEEAGRCRRGYFVDRLGAGQFALPGAVDRMRTMLEPSRTPAALVLAAADPANPYGAALDWPARPDADVGHRPGRKPGALVVLVDGEPALYLERGGRSALTFTDDPEVLAAAAGALAAAVRRRGVPRLVVQRADGSPVAATPIGPALAAAGFLETPRGLALRA
ncbi:MAG: ATP-dependent helicase [Actinomycetota bacterium]